MAYVARQNTQVVTASGLDALAGLWLVLSPWVLAFQVPAATTNNIIFGLLITLLAAIRFFGAFNAAWVSWVNAVLGLWVLLSPWFLGFTAFEVPTTNNIILGIIVIVLASWSALATEAGNRSDRFERGYDRDQFGQT